MFLKTKEQKYYILTLSQNNIKLYQATPYTIEEIKLNDVPNNLDDFLSSDEFERSLQARSSTSKSNSKIFYSSGDKKADTKKNQLLRYFNKVNDGVIEALHEQDKPLILVGVEYLMAIYKKANKYSNLVDGIKGNADKMSIEELHQATLKVNLD